MPSLSPRRLDETFKKWISESVNLKVVFVSVNSGVHLFAGGALKKLPGGFAVCELADGEKDRLAFNTEEARSSELLDGTGACAHPLAARFFPGMVFRSGAVFVFKNAETLLLLEVGYNTAN